MFFAELCSFIRPRFFRPSLIPQQHSVLPSFGVSMLLLAIIFTAPAPHSYGQSPENSGEAPPPQPRGFDNLESGAELVNLDFPELTNIKEIIKAISLWTGKNVILDQNVNGKIQIISPRPVTKVEAYEAFKSALNVLNLTPVETGKFIKILPIRSALKDNLKTFYGAQFSPSTDQVITQVIPLKFVDAKAIRTMLSKFVPASSLVAYEPTNTLIVSESGFKVNRVLEIIRYLDVETEQSQVAIVPIIYSDAKHIANQVKQIFTGTRQGASSRPSSYHTYKIFPDAKTNSVVIFGPPRTIKDVRDLVKKFDIKVEDLSRQATIHVRPLDYADAKKLAATLNSLTSSGNSSNNSRFPALSRLRRAANSSRSRTNNPTTEEPSVADLGSGVKISADESSNSLLITGSRSAYNAINAIVRKMDVKKSQVFIEADILDIAINNQLTLGASVFAGVPIDKSKNIIGLGGWEGGRVAPLVLAGSAASSGDEGAAGTALAGAAQAFSSDFTFGILAGEGIDIPGFGKISPAALINMLKADSNTRVLSSPHILISNNEPGLFSSGSKVFFRGSQPNETTGTLVPTIESERIELRLQIKPNISHSDFVTMQINLDADSLAGNDPSTNLPIVSKRSTKQSVTVKNSQTVVISGLVDTSESETFRKIPLLGDIPILGWLFRNTETSKKRSNLVIFITAHIIHGPNDLARIYREKIEQRDKMLEYWNTGFTGLGGDLKNDEFYALLPQAEDGVFKPSEIDLLEDRRLNELRQQLLQDMGYSGDDPTGEDPLSREEVITTVPLMPESSAPAPGELPTDVIEENDLMVPERERSETEVVPPPLLNNFQEVLKEDDEESQKEE